MPRNYEADALIFTSRRGDVLVRSNYGERPLLGVITRAYSGRLRYKIVGEDTYAPTVGDLINRLLDRHEGKTV